MPAEVSAGDLALYDTGMGTVLARIIGVREDGGVDVELAATTSSVELNVHPDDLEAYEGDVASLGVEHVDLRRQNWSPRGIQGVYSVSGQQAVSALQAVGVETLGQLATLDSETAEQITTETNVPDALIREWVNAARNAVGGQG